MPLLVKARSFLRNLIFARRVDADLDQEVRSHLELLIEEKIREGMSPTEAQRAARIELGGIAQVQEQVREERLGNWLHSVLSDCRYGLRHLRKNPGTTAVMVFTLALGIGATTAIFSVVYGVLLRPLPYADAEPDHGGVRGDFEGPAVAPRRSELRRFPRSEPQLPNDGEVRRLRRVRLRAHRSRRARWWRTSRPTSSRFSAFSRCSGRDFSDGDAKKGAGPTALVSYGYWRQYLGSPQDLSQSHLKIDGAVYSVIGVLPAGFRFPADVDLWLPADLDGENPSRTSHNYSAVAACATA